MGSRWCRVGPDLRLAGWLGLAGVLAPQESVPSYAAADLACAAFRDSVRTTTRLLGPGGSQEEALARDGVLLLRGRPAPGGLRVEAWYDALALRREGPFGVLVPDTDGLIGGRWWALLGPGGEARIETRPFLPDDVRQASDLSELLLDFFPPLPPVPLGVGAVWSDSAGLEIRRVSDSSAGPRRLTRFEWQRARFGPGDTLLVREQRSEDRGIVVWDRRIGPVAWTRRVIVESELRRQGATPPLRSRVEQHAAVRRIEVPGPCR